MKFFSRQDFFLFSPNALLSLIVVLAIVLRFIGLDFQSLWLDEIYTMNMADPVNSWKEIYQLSFTHDPLSVLYFILLNTFFKFFGFTSFVARFFSLTFGIAGVFVTYYLGKTLRSVSVGLTAAFLLAINPFHIQYSQEARVYTMYLFAAGLSFYALIQFIRQPDFLKALWYGLSVLFMLMSHFFGFFVLLAQASIFIYFAFKNKKVSVGTYFKLAGVSAIIAIAGYIPFVPIFIMLTKSNGTWIDPPGSDALLRLYLDFQGGSWILVTEGILCMLIIPFRRFIQTKNLNETNEKAKLQDAVILLSLWILISFLIPYALSVFRFPIFYKRYMISYLPPFLLLTALGLDCIGKKFLKIGFIFAIAASTWFHLFPSTDYYKTVAKSDFRGISEFIIQNNAMHFPVYTSLPYHYDFFFRNAGCKEMIRSANVDSIFNTLRTGRMPMHSFWMTDAHGRAFTVSPENQKLIDEKFDLFFLENKFDAWARLYLLKDPSVDSTIVVLRRNDFAKDKVPTSSLFENGELRTKVLKLKPGRYKMVIKALSTPSLPIAGKNAHLIVSTQQKTLGNYYLGSNSFVDGDTLNFSGEDVDGQEIILEFDNDTCAGKADRNMILREVLIIPD